MESVNFRVIPIIYPKTINVLRKWDEYANWRKRLNKLEKLAFVRRSRNDWKLPTHNQPCPRINEIWTDFRGSFMSYLTNPRFLK